MWGSYVDLLKGLSLSVVSGSRLPGPAFAGYDRILSGPKQAVLRAAWRSWIGMRYGSPWRTIPGRARAPALARLAVAAAMAALRSDEAAQEDTAAVTAHTLEVPSSAAALWLSPPPQEACGFESLRGDASSWVVASGPLSPVPVVRGSMR